MIENEQEHKVLTINYFPGGWQAGHFPTEKYKQLQQKVCFLVLCSWIHEPTRDNPFNGCLYTIMQDPNGYTYDHKFHPTPGKVVVMDDRVWHGTYPTEDLRRCLVWDFDID